MNRKNCPRVCTIVIFLYYTDEQLQTEDHPDQNQLLKATQDPPTREIYEAVKERIRTVSKENGIDKLFREKNLNILAFPMDSLLVFISAASGRVQRGNP